MTKQEFLSKQSEEAKHVFETLDTLIRIYDKEVTVEVGSIMNSKEALVYKQDSVFKYGLTATKNHFSYHSMVMYAFPKVLAHFKTTATAIKFQKGCFNFKSIEAINLQNFKAFLQLSSLQDFNPVINHYKSKKK